MFSPVQPEDEIVVPPQVAEPAGTLGPDKGFQELDVQLVMFLKKAYGLYVLVAPTGHMVSVPEPANLSNPCTSCARIGRQGDAVLLLWQ
jgi:hypothetical protein